MVVAADMDLREGRNSTGRNGSGDGLAVRIVFRSKVCPFLYTVNVILLPTDLCSSIYEIKSSIFVTACPSTAVIISPPCFFEY